MGGNLHQTLACHRYLAPVPPPVAQPTWLTGMAAVGIPLLPHRWQRCSGNLVPGVAVCPPVRCPSWRRGWRCVPASALLRESDGRLLGASCGAAVSPLPSGADLQPWWPGIGCHGHLKADPAHLLVKGHCAVCGVAICLSVMRDTHRRCWLQRWGASLLLRAAAPTTGEVAGCEPTGWFILGRCSARQGGGLHGGGAGLSASLAPPLAEDGLLLRSVVIDDIGEVWTVLQG
jgi:hypothetical protein